jgi:ectoine hydroxylase-related dioxygenase (phytanoyl-CoA dioxygenase family)
MTTPFVLSADDIFRFETMGFLVFRQFFTPSETADIEAAFMRVITKAAEKAGYNGAKRLAVVPFVEYDEAFLHLLNHDAVNALMEGLLGKDCLYMNASDGNYYVGNTRWHPDGGNPDYRTIKIALYLDRVGENSGCLSVIPGSHHAPFQAAIARGIKSGVYDVDSPDLPGRYPLPSEPGDLVLFHHALWHSSWGGGRDRRMFTIQYAANPEFSWQAQHLRGLLEVFDHRVRGHRLYSERLVQNAGPLLAPKLRKLIEQGYCAESLRPLTEADLIIHGS